MKVGDRASWLASRYRRQMEKGKIVYFWLGGDPRIRGLYGWGIITAQAPELRENKVYRIEVQYRCSFLDQEPPGHIPSTRIRQDPILENHLIFRMPIGTNFLLTDEEDQRTIIANAFGDACVPPQSWPIAGG
jgi:hypothetical protein